MVVNVEEFEPKLSLSFETLVAVISAWSGINKISPPIFDYRLLCVLTNNLLVFTVCMEHPVPLVGI